MIASPTCFVFQLKIPTYSPRRIHDGRGNENEDGECGDDVSCKKTAGRKVRRRGVNSISWAARFVRSLHAVWDFEFSIQDLSPGTLLWLRHPSRSHIENNRVLRLAALRSRYRRHFVSVQLPRNRCKPSLQLRVNTRDWNTYSQRARLQFSIFSIAPRATSRLYLFRVCACQTFATHTRRLFFVKIIAVNQVNS